MHDVLLAAEKHGLPILVQHKAANSITLFWGKRFVFTGDLKEEELKIVSICLTRSYYILSINYPQEIVLDMSLMQWIILDDLKSVEEDYQAEVKKII